MHIIRKPRGGGKTYALIMEAAKDPAESIIVCPTYRQVIMVVEMARILQLEIQKPITIEQLLDGQLAGKGVTHVLIDNVDQIINRWIGDRDLAVTLTD